MPAGRSVRSHLLADALQASGSSPSHALFAKGFRPFFLVAAAFAICMLPIWILVFFGVISVDGYLGATIWHAHEMIFGFVAAVIAGFLLTAVGNWTQRETLTGAPLAALCALWLAGRVVVTFASHFPRGVPGILDLAFLPALMLVIARPLVLAKKVRNFVMLVVLAALFACNVAVHLEALGFTVGTARHGCLVGVDIITLLMLIMAGRVFPMFTRNATAAESIRSVPRLDALTVAAMALLTALDVVVPESHFTAVVSAGVGALALWRSRTWGARRSFGRPMLWILHVGYLWIPTGLILRGVAVLDESVLPSLSTHALTVGAMGSLTLGMMVRVGLGHTGRPLEASRPIVVAFVLVSLGAIARVFVPLANLAWYRDALIAAGVLWSAAFALYLVVFVPILSAPRVDGSAG